MKISGAAPSRLLLAACLVAPLASAACASAPPAAWLSNPALATPAAEALLEPAPEPPAARLPAALAARTAAPPEEPSGDAGFGRSGLYLGAYGIQSYERFDDDGSSVHFGDSDLGAGLKIGYRMSFLAVEVFAEDVRGFEVDGGSVESDLDLMSVGAAGKLILGDGRLQPYLLLGAGTARSDVSDFDFDDDGWFARGGLGLDVYITEHFAVFAEANYNRMMGSVSDLDYANLALGILFRF